MAETPRNPETPIDGAQSRMTSEEILRSIWGSQKKAGRQEAAEVQPAASHESGEQPRGMAGNVREQMRERLNNKYCTGVIIIVGTDASTVTVKFNGKILRETGPIPEIREKLLGLTDSENVKIVVDFSGLEYLPSAALAVLIELNKELKKNGGQLRFCCMGKDVEKVFHVTNLNELFMICETHESALQSLQKQPVPVA